jgi:hypothetical protein
VIRAALTALALLASPQTTSSLNGPLATIADAIQYAAPSSGATVTVAPDKSTLIIDNASLLATLTVTLPGGPIDGQRVTIVSGAGVTALTVNGGTIKGLITALSINGYARFVYSASANAWFRSG